MSTTLNSAHDVGEAARNLCRDFPKWFEETHSPLQSATVKLSHPLIGSVELRAVEDGGEILDADWDIDYRNGVLKFHDPQAVRTGVTVLGYFYEWFLPEDLTYYAELAMAESLNGRGDLQNGWSSFSTEEKNAVAMATVTYAYFALMTELSTDINVSTPEGMMIPAQSRFQQVMSLYQMWQKKSDEINAMLNMGLNRLEVQNLRRVSRTTGRLVPTFRAREVDDPRPPIRVWPPVSTEGLSPEEGGQEGAGPGTMYGPEVWA